ncbi:redoxin domain-containing protein [Cohnella laeviribosi]|uniref:redoxin domain-containing protein n=1 Tax=Cohnella laeviribosi TaxID=380174 RepID=UPI000A0224A8|nr:redoxin domain-containing protein [Cohnella laeviribosi]
MYFNGVQTGFGLPLLFTNQSVKIRNGGITLWESKKRWIQVAVLFAFVIIGGITIGSTFLSGDGIPRNGKEAPAFSLLDLNGQVHRLSDYRGKVVVINFWGTFCPPCREEMPAIQKQYEKWREKGLVVLGLNLNESAVTIQGFVRQTGVTFPILFDKDLLIAKKYNVTAYPTTFFVSPDGIIQNIFVGGMTENYIQQQIDQIFKSYSNR